MFVLLPSGRVSDRQSVWVFCNREMGVSENRGPQYSTLNSRIPLIFGNSQIPVRKTGQVSLASGLDSALLTGKDPVTW